MLSFPINISKKALSIRTIRFYSPRKDDEHLSYIGWIRGVFIRFAMATRVNLKPYLRENISRYIEYRSTDIRSVSRKGKAREGIFSNEWTVRWERRFYQNTRISARSLDIVSAGNAFLAFVARLDSIFEREIKRSRVVSFSRYRITLHLQREILVSERSSGSLGSIAQGQPAFVNARHALTPSGRICIQQRKCAALRCWPWFTVTYR